MNAQLRRDVPTSGTRQVVDRARGVIRRVAKTQCGAPETPVKRADKVGRIGKHVLTLPAHYGSGIGENPHSVAQRGPDASPEGSCGDTSMTPPWRAASVARGVGRYPHGLMDYRLGRPGEVAGAPRASGARFIPAAAVPRVHPASAKQLQATRSTIAAPAQVARRCGPSRCAAPR